MTPDAELLTLAAARITELERQLAEAKSGNRYAQLEAQARAENARLVAENARLREALWHLRFESGDMQVNRERADAALAEEKLMDVKEELYLALCALPEGTVSLSGNDVTISYSTREEAEIAFETMLDLHLRDLNNVEDRTDF